MSLLGAEFFIVSFVAYLFTAPMLTGGKTLLEKAQEI